jgi:hypothetical protein
VLLLGLHVQNKFKVAPLVYKDESGVWKTVKYSQTADGRVDLDPFDQNQANAFWKIQEQLPADFQEPQCQYVVLAGNNRFLLCHETILQSSCTP